MVALRKAARAAALWLALGACSADEGAAAAHTLPELPALPSRDTCSADASCTPCPAAGTGVSVGDQIADVAFTRVDGSEQALHASCSSGRGLLIVETAPWCTLCIDRLPLLRAWHATYGALGVDVLFVLGENATGGLPTTADLQEYRAAHALPDDWGVVLDPRWVELSEVVLHPGEGRALPYFLLLDGDMRLRYLGNGGDKETFSEVSAALEALTGTPFPGCGAACQ